MIRVWAVPLWTVLCALQCWLASAEPRPDFALRGPVYGSVPVLNAASDLGSEAVSLIANLELTLESDYPGLSALLQGIGDLGGGLQGRLSSVLGPLNSITNADSASEYSTFQVTLDAIDDASEWLDEGFGEIVESLGDIVRHPLPSQFNDAFRRIDGGLQELRDALHELSEYVGDVLSSGSGEEHSCRRRRNVPPRLVYRVVYAVRNLRAYLPLVAFLINTTVENLQLLDVYLVRLANESDDASDIQQYLALVFEGVLPVQTSVSAAIQDVQSEFTAELAELGALSCVSSVSSYPALVSALNGYQAALGQLSSASSGFYNALHAIGDSLGELLLDPAPDVPAIDNARVVRTLVQTLLSNGPYSRYCFYKYSELLFSFADVGVHGVEECIDREVERIQYLETTLLREVAALVYDFEDLAEDLAACDRTHRTNQRNQCVNRLAQYFNQLAANFDVKFDLIFSHGIAEATASKYRLLSCVASLQFRLIDESNDDLRHQIRQCSRHGPYCDRPEESEPTARVTELDDDADDEKEAALLLGKFLPTEA